MHLEQGADRDSNPGPACPPQRGVRVSTDGFEVRLVYIFVRNSMGLISFVTLNECRTVFLGKIIVAQPAKKFPHFIHHCVHYSYHRAPSWTTWCIPYHHILFILILSFHVRQFLLLDVYTSDFTTKFCTNFTRATCPADLILLDFIVVRVFGEQYQLWSSSPCICRHSAVTLSFYDVFKPTQYFVIFPIFDPTQCWGQTLRLFIGVRNDGTSLYT